MQLSNEDNLRLNVLLRQDLKAVRIDESRMVVHALSERGEARVPLHPTCREEKYLRLVRELLSTHVLGSPGGYPVYIRRWTRMGQARDDASLARLLLLGEPEAVVAVVHSPGLTHEIAERAWWAHPTAEIGRQLLTAPAVVEGPLGREVAAFLLEFLPFEEEPRAIIDSVRLVLQPGLIDEDARQALWARGRRKQTYYIGFLHSTPDNLPEPPPAHAEHAALAERLAGPAADGNPWARQLLRSLSGPGQAFFRTVRQVLAKLPNQDAAASLMNAIGAYYWNLRPDTGRYRSMADAVARAEGVLASPPADLAPVLALVPEQRERLRAMLALSMVDEFTVAPILGKTDAIGSVMRKRLLPVTEPLLAEIDRLQPA